MTTSCPHGCYYSNCKTLQVSRNFTPSSRNILLSQQSFKRRPSLLAILSSLPRANTIIREMRGGRMNCPLLQSNQATATEHFNLSNIISRFLFLGIQKSCHFTEHPIYIQQPDRGVIDKWISKRSESNNLGYFKALIEINTSHHPYAYRSQGWSIVGMSGAGQHSSWSTIAASTESWQWMVSVSPSLI